MTSTNLQFEQQGSEDSSLEEFEQQDSGEEAMNELDFAEKEESNSQRHLSRVIKNWR